MQHAMQQLFVGLVTEFKSGRKLQASVQTIGQQFTETEEGDVVTFHVFLELTICIGSAVLANYERGAQTQIGNLVQIRLQPEYVLRVVQVRMTQTHVIGSHECLLGKGLA